MTSCHFKVAKTKPLNFYHWLLFLVNLWNKYHSLSSPSPSRWDWREAKDRVKFRRFCWYNLFDWNFAGWNFNTAALTTYKQTSVRIKTTDSKCTSCTWLWFIYLSLYICVSQTKVCKFPTYDLLCQEMLKNKTRHDTAPLGVYFSQIWK